MVHAPFYQWMCTLPLQFFSEMNGHILATLLWTFTPTRKAAYECAALLPTDGFAVQPELILLFIGVALRSPCGAGYISKEVLDCVIASLKTSDFTKDPRNMAMVAQALKAMNVRAQLQCR